MQLNENDDSFPVKNRLIVFTNEDKKVYFNP